MPAHKVSNFRFPPEEVQRWRESATRNDFPSLTAWLLNAARSQLQFESEEQAREGER